MKKFLLLFLMLGSLTLTAQTTIDLSGMTEDVTLGQNCSASQTPQEYVTTGDVNLNGFELDLRNVNLTVNGNINGGGEIEACGQSTICYTGAIQNNPEFDDITAVSCSTLSNPEFTTEDRFSFDNRTKTVTIKNSKFIKVFDMNGREVLSTKEETLNFSTLSDGLYIFKSDKFTKKLPVY